MIEENNPQNSKNESEEKENSNESSSGDTQQENLEEEATGELEDENSILEEDSNQDVDETSEELMKDVESDVEIVDLSDADLADIDLDDEEKFKDMLKNFSDIDDLSIEEMMEIQSAIDDVMDVDEDSAEIQVETVDEESISGPIEDLYEGWGIYEEIKPEFKPEISDDLESLIQEELEKKKLKKKVVTEEEFKQYCMDRKTKIWYHALWTLVFDIEDHQAQKDTLYELLKEVTSKSPIDPIQEHKFYFGLGFILRLSVNGKKVIEFRGEKLKLNVGIDILNDILHEVGPPISERPVISESEKKKMFIDFLTDDFKDI
jgi:hypothetical protein